MKKVNKSLLNKYHKAILHHSLSNYFVEQAVLNTTIN